MLSVRETQVLRLLLAGHDAKSAATSLGLSVHTVNERLRDARRKLGVSSSREAARLLGQSEQAAPEFLGDKELGADFPADITFGVAGAAPATQTSRERRQVRATPSWLAGGILAMSLTIAAFLLLSAVNSSGGAQAPSAAPAGPPQAMDLMTIADMNRDGNVSADEYDVFSRQGWMFVSQGKNAVKLIELDEVGKMAILGIAPDADGRITQQMYHEAIPARFRMLDRDGDGALNSDELNGRSAPA